MIKFCMASLSLPAENEGGQTLAQQWKTHRRLMSRLLSERYDKLPVKPFLLVSSQPLEQNQYSGILVLLYQFPFRRAVQGHPSFTVTLFITFCKRKCFCNFFSDPQALGFPREHQLTTLLWHRAISKMFWKLILFIAWIPFPVIIDVFLGANLQSYCRVLQNLICETCEVWDPEPRTLYWLADGRWWCFLSGEGTRSIRLMALCSCQIRSIIGFCVWKGERLRVN